MYSEKSRERRNKKKEILRDGEDIWIGERPSSQSRPWGIILIFFCSVAHAMLKVLFEIKKPWILYSWCVLLLSEGSNLLPSLRMGDCHERPFNCLEAACKCKLHFDFFWAIWNFFYSYLWRLCSAFEFYYYAQPFSIHAQFFLHCTFLHHYIFTYCCCKSKRWKLQPMNSSQILFCTIFS